MSINYMISDYT